MQENQEKSLANVLVMMSVDGKITAEEKSFVEKLKTRFDIDNDDFSSLLEQFRNSPKHMAIPRGEEGRDVFKLLVEAAQADDTIAEPEQRLLQRVAKHVGLSDIEAQPLIPGAEESIAEIDEKIAQIYESFNKWDSKTRAARVEDIAKYGPLAVVSLLKVLESYRVPEGLPDNLELKTLVAEQLGQLGDKRAVYYMAQHVNIGDTDDEISNASLRNACAEAIEKLVGRKFDPENKLDAMRQWWISSGKDDYSELAI